jgi:N-carbamoyl-L-amino-acid hydrolase
MTTEVDATRLWQTILETGRIGATEGGGVCRLTLSDEDRRVRDWFVEACEREGCRVTVDEMGNIFARRRGRRDDLPPIAIGSHLDTQPTGGRFDGILGVLAGLEVVRTLNANGIETERPIEVIDWTNEEGARFAPAMLGSGVFAGVLDKEFALGREDREGRRFGDELEGIGYGGEEPCGRHPLDSYFELHIEQGPVLEAEKKTIGIVEGAQGTRWYDVALEGAAAHAGTTPMAMRRDASLAAARIISAANDLCEEIGPGTFATTGVIEAHPNSRNVVPSRVFLTVDLRHTKTSVLDRMEKRLEAIVAESCARGGVAGKLERIWDSPPVRFHRDCVAAVREAALASGHPCREIVSGAGHDAVYVSRAVPTAMIFVPCKDGVSHNESESAEPKHVAAGASVLLGAVLVRDRAVGSSGVE